MKARMENPAMVLSDAMKAIEGLYQAMSTGGVPQTTLELVHLRASQINGCASCIVSGARTARKAGVADEQLWSLVAWRESPYFDEAERAALDLTEYATRLAGRDRPDAVPDDVWDEAARHYDEQGLSAVILMIRTANLFDRINTAVQVRGRR